MKPFCMGFPGAMKCQSMAVSLSQTSMALQVNCHGQTRSCFAASFDDHRQLAGDAPSVSGMPCLCKHGAMANVSGAECRLQDVEALIQRQQSELAECNDGRLFLPTQGSRGWLPRSHSGIVTDDLALHLATDVGVDPVSARQGSQAVLTMSYRSRAVRLDVA
jgi:hypothetical protein